jgi:hypothetical protein
VVVGSSGSAGGGDPPHSRTAPRCLCAGRPPAGRNRH